MWAALLGAAVGGFFALAAGALIELRRDRRRQLAAARMVVSELRRSQLAIFGHTYVARSKARDMGRDQVEELRPTPSGTWLLYGPHPDVGVPSWQRHAHEFVSALSEDDFNLVEGIAYNIDVAGEHGWAIDEEADEPTAEKLSDVIVEASERLEPVAKPTWVDRRIWRL